MNRHLTPQVATEILRVISFLPQEQINKIPKNEIIYLNKIKDNNYKTKINEVDDIKAENLMKDTKKYLAYIFIHYLASTDENKEYKIILRENEIRYQKYIAEKYDINKIFQENKKRNNTNLNNQDLVVVKGQGLLKRIIDKLKKLFKKNQENQ